MLALADIDHQILCLRGCAYDHALIYRNACADKQRATLLGIEQTVGNSLAGLERDQRTGAAAGNIAFIRRIFIEHAAHDALTLGVGQKFTLIAEQATGRDEECQTGTAALGVHILEFCLTGTQLFHYRTHAVFRHVNGQFLDRLIALAVYFVIQNTRRRNAQLISLTAHILDENGQVHFTTSGNPERIGAFCLCHTQGHVTEQFPHETVTQLTGSNELAFLSGKGAVVDAECHFHSRFTDLGERQRLKAFWCADSVADGDVLDAADPDDIAHGCRFCRNTLESLDLEQRNDLVAAGVLRVMIVAQQHLLSHLDGTSFDSADTDSAHVFIIVDGRDQHLQRLIRVALRRIHIRHNGVEQRFQILALTVGFKACSTSTAGAVQERGVLQLFLAGIQIHQQFQYFVCDLIQTSVRTVDLVDNNDDLQIHFQRLGQHETSLRHRALCGIDQQDRTVYHAQNTFYLAAEVSVSRGINNIDLGVTVAYRCILCQDRDATFPFQIIGVHNTFCHCLVFPEYTALFQHLVDQSCLTVVYVCDDSNISQILTNHNFLLISHGMCCHGPAP